MFEDDKKIKVKQKMKKEVHKRYMQLALELAKKAEGKTSPNPLVGAVIVKNGKIIGKGFHEKAGKPHAEINAINSVKDKRQLKGSTLYVNLEPCCHYGKTGPCTDEIIKSGIKEVYIAMLDPNPMNNGKGLAKLKKAGIKVNLGLMEKEARKLNEFFIKFITTKKPFVMMKTAMSLDGKIATKTGHSKWISCRESREHVHKLRNIVDAIIVGINTILKDDPRLTTRLNIKEGNNPLRIVLDSTLKIPLKARVLDNNNVMIATTSRCSKKKKKILEKKGIKVVIVKSKNKKVDLNELMKKLALMGVTSVMIEGGSEVNASALEAGIVDKIIYFIAPIIIGGKNAKTAVGGRGIKYLNETIKLREIKVKKIGSDMMVEGYIDEKKH